MKAQDIRAKFLDFFTDKEHKIVASAPMVMKNDPTLMFTNAGMNQFKEYFLGNKSAADKAAAIPFGFFPPAVAKNGCPPPPP